MYSPQQGAVALQKPSEDSGDWVKERKKGLLAVVGAFGVLMINLVSLLTTEYFFPKTLAIAGGLGAYGGWVLIFGDEYDDHTMELVQWKRIGMYAVAVLGAGLGLLISMLIAE